MAVTHGMIVIVEYVVVVQVIFRHGIRHRHRLWGLWR